jgi:hypothetical protein
VIDTKLASLSAGYTVADVARRHRVSPDWIRELIRKGKLRAISTARTKSGRPRFVILPEHLAEYESGIEVGQPVERVPRRKRLTRRDYLPEL